jgi:hypothetical protein
MDSDNSNIRHHHQPEEKAHDGSLKLRNLLNIIFMIGAVAGVALYFLVSQTIGTIVILAAIVFKIIECCIRFFH